MIASRPVPVWGGSSLREAAENARPLPVAPFVALGFMVLAFGLGFAWLAVQRHLAYQTHAFDMGNMDQAVWNTLHGHPLQFTDMGAGHAVITSRLAIHVEPILFALAPLYLLHSGPETLLVVQALVVASGLIPAYLLALHVLGRPWLALIFPAAYLAHPSLQNALLYDFHAVVLSAALLMWAIYFTVRGWAGPFWAVALLGMATKEEIGLLIALLGVVWMLRGGRLTGLGALAVGIAWFLISVVIIIPHFNPSGHSPYLGRYAYLGHGFGGIVIGALRHPGLVAHTLLSRPRLSYLWATLGPLGFVPILGLPVLLLALPTFLINMLSADPRMYGGQYQYSAELIPYLVAAATFGVWVVRRLTPGRAGQGLSSALAVFALAASLVATRFFGFSPLAEGYVLPRAGPHQQLENTILRQIPPTAVVAAADEIEPHLSDRPWIYMLPRIHASNGPTARYIVLDASVPAATVLPRDLHFDALWALSHGYGVQEGRAGILILKRGARERRLPPRFFSFMYPAGSPATRAAAWWGGIRLVGVTVHPLSGHVTASRPDVIVDLYLQVHGLLPGSPAVSIYVSPNYRGRHPGYSAGWKRQTDSAAWDWLPLRSWPRGRTLEATTVPLNAPTSALGDVDVAVGIAGAGKLVGVPVTRRVTGAPNLLRVATLTAGY